MGSSPVDVLGSDPEDGREGPAGVAEDFGPITFERRVPAADTETAARAGRRGAAPIDVSTAPVQFKTKYFTN